jgi:hypothetical protein
MGKLMDRLQKQLKTERKQEAEDCIQLYEYLKQIDDGNVWGSKWETLVDTTFEEFPSSERWCKPNDLGRLVLIGLNLTQ